MIYVYMLENLVPENVDFSWDINPLNAELNHIFYLLALLGAHNFLHVSRIGVKMRGATADI
jgi:hypothetical protein